MAEDNIRYGMILRQSDNETLLSGSISSNSKAYSKEAGKVKEKMLQAGLNPNERKKFVSPKNGNWQCECDGNKILFVVLVADGYPERLGYELIDKLRKGLVEVPNYFALSPMDTEKAFFAQFEQLMGKYNDPKSFDATSSVSAKVDLAKSKMENNMKAALANTQDLQNVESKTNNLKEMAKEMEKDSDELRKIMYWRNMKLKMIMTIMGGAASFSVILPIIQKFTT